MLTLPVAVLFRCLSQLSFRLRRFCEGTQGASGAAAFNGVSFPGSQVGNVTYFLLNPSQMTTSVTCSVNATCENGGCRCKPGFVGDGFTCTPCAGTNVCKANFACPGGPACGTTCNPGYILSGDECIPAPTKLVTVMSEKPNTGCSGTQLSSYSAFNNVSCNADCQQGPASSASFCGASRGVPTYCCYRPTFLWKAEANPSFEPGDKIKAYPYFSLPIMVRARAQRPPAGSSRRRINATQPMWPCLRMSSRGQPAASTENICLTNVRLSSTDAGTGCATSNFQFGFLKDDDWFVRLWRQRRQHRWRRFTDELQFDLAFARYAQGGCRPDVGKGDRAEQQ